MISSFSMLSGTMPGFFPSRRMLSVLVRHHLLRSCDCVAMEFGIAHLAFDVFAPFSEIVEEAGI